MKTGQRRTERLQMRLSIKESEQLLALIKRTDAPASEVIRKALDVYRELLEAKDQGSTIIIRLCDNTEIQVGLLGF